MFLERKKPRLFSDCEVEMGLKRTGTNGQVDRRANGSVFGMTLAMTK